MAQPQVLFVDDDKSFCTWVAGSLARRGFDVQVSSSSVEAIEVAYHSAALIDSSILCACLALLDPAVGLHNQNVADEFFRHHECSSD